MQQEGSYINQQNPAQLLNECRNCKMKFENSASLANHVQKFCTNSQYADKHKLEQRMMELGHNEFTQPTNINFQDVRAYLKGNRDENMTQKTIGKMSLEDMRNQMQAENRKFEDIQREGTRRKEQELIADLGDLKKEKNFLRQQRTEQENNMHGLIKELELRNERELRAKIERDEIQRALKEIEKTKISALERDKRRELERLAAERENLRLKEEDVMDEIRQLEGKLYEKERAMKEQQERKNDNVNNSEYYGKIMRNNAIQFAKDRGEQIAALQMKKEQLEQDRLRIMDDLDKVKVGDFDSLRKNEASRWVANDIIKKGNALKGGTGQSLDFARVKLDPQVKDKLVNDQARINQLKEQQEKLQRDALIEIDELDAFAKQWGVPSLNNNNYVKNRNPVQIQPQKHSQSYDNLYGDGGPYVNELYQSQQIPASYKNRQQQPLDNDNVLLDRLRQIRQDYEREGDGRPEFYLQLDEIENHILNKDKQSGSPPSKTMAPPQQQQPSVTHIHHDMQQPTLQAFTPGMYPPPIMQGPPAYPINFYPQGPNGYMPPPPPLPNGEQSIERFNQYNNSEPAPVMAQPYLNPQINAMNQLIQEQELQNDFLERELQALQQGHVSSDQFQKILGDSDQELNKLKQVLLGKNGKQFGGGRSNEPFPEDFIFRQNDYRSEDLEVEERVIMNIQSQDYDQVRIVSKLPANSELYRFKMDQYKEQSTVRAEVEKVYQEQRLEKIRRDFEKQKYEDERKFKHDKWLEDQKRGILEAKLKNAARPKPQTPVNDYAPQMMIPQTQQSFRPPPSINERPQSKQNSVAEFMQPDIVPQTQQYTQDPNLYDATIGYNLNFDFVARLQRQFRSMRIVYAVYNVSRSVVSPSLIEVRDSEPDPEDNDKNRVIYKEMHTIKHVQPHPSSNLILEFQVPKPQTMSADKFVSYGWTILNLFDSNYDLYRGMFRIPIYMSPTKTDLDVRDIRTLKRIPDTVICCRISNPGDETSRFIVQPHTSSQQYVVPRIHQFSNTPPRSPLTQQQDLAIPDAPVSRGNQIANYECKGIHLEVHYIKQYMPPMHAKIQCTLFEGNQIVNTKDNKPCNWASKMIDGNSVMNTIGNNPLNAGMAFTPNGIARGEILGVDDNTTWIKDLYSQQQKNNFKDDINLVVQIMEYTAGRRLQNHEIGQEYTPIGYAVLKVNNQDGTIRYGTYELDFFKPPVNLSRRNQIDALKQTIKLTIGQPHFTNARQLTVNPQNPDQQKPPLQIEPNQQSNQPNNSSSDRPFIPNQMKQYDEVRFTDGEGIDFYIDGCRFLPENTTYSRVLMRAFTLDQFRVMNATKGLSDLAQSKGRNPFYGFRQEIRASQIDPTMSVLITIETIDRSNNMPKIVGYAYFSLFLNGTNKQAVQDRNSTNNILQSGSYQIPLYKNRISVDKDVNLENIQSLEKIPCASVLIRCFKAPVEGSKVLSVSQVPQTQWRQKGLIKDPPEYGQGVYNTSYCLVSQFEGTLFDLKQGRPNPPMRDVVQYLKQMNKREMQMNDGDTLRWLDKLLVTNFNTPSLNVKFWSAYEPKYGIKFGIERIHNISLKMPHVAVVSLIPPGSLYSDPPKRSQDVQYFIDFDWNSSLQSVQFVEDLVTMTGLPPNPKLAFLIDIKAIKFVGSQIQFMTIGWTLMPVFAQLSYEDGMPGIFSNQGLTALPIWSGPVNQDLIANALQSLNPIETLKQQKTVKMIDNASVICRLHDNQREFIPRKGYYGDIDNQYLPQAQLAKYAYNDANKRQVNGGTTFNNIMPNGFTKESYLGNVENALNEYYGI